MADESACVSLDDRGAQDLQCNELMALARAIRGWAPWIDVQRGSASRRERNHVPG